VWTQKCAVQKASVDVNISYYYLEKKEKSWTQGPGFFLIKKRKRKPGHKQVLQEQIPLI
jgi:hypothetical protein